MNCRGTPKGAYYAVVMVPVRVELPGDSIEGPPGMNRRHSLGQTVAKQVSELLLPVAEVLSVDTGYNPQVVETVTPFVAPGAA